MCLSFALGLVVIWLGFGRSWVVLLGYECKGLMYLMVRCIGSILAILVWGRIV